MTSSHYDVIIVGSGAGGGTAAHVLTAAGKSVLVLEAGHNPFPGLDAKALPFPLHSNDELKYAVRDYIQQQSFLEPRVFRMTSDVPGNLAGDVNLLPKAVGGAFQHADCAVPRFTAVDFRMRSTIEAIVGTRPALAVPGFGADAASANWADWPFSYADLEPFYVEAEDLYGVQGDAQANPFQSARSAPYPMPPLRPFRLGETFREATAAMGLHPHPVPVGMNSVPYDGRPATTYTAWSNGFGSYTDDKWYPGISSIPQALATGNLDLRTHCRVVRIVADGEGHASGVEYVDANGNRHLQAARTVILCSYVYENVRLLLLSGDARHANGLGNNADQVGRHYMTKMFAHVDGFFPEMIFNRHTGPAAQGIVLDDFVSDEFDSLAHGFVGGATLGAENQFLPIQISREALPDALQRWGKPYKDHLRQWQHFGVVRIQPDALPYAVHRIDLDPHHRDRSGLGLPVVRITYDLRENERRLSNWMEAKSAEILRAMGATKTWRGPSFTGVGSSHDFGVCRMGDDPATSVVDPELRVHDTPGLYVLGGATFPSCPGINPTLTMWAICYRAAERLVARLRAGEEA